MFAFAKAAAAATTGLLATRQSSVVGPTSTTSTTREDLISSTFTTNANTTALLLNFAGCAQQAGSNGVYFQLMVDGVAICAGGSRASSSSTAGAALALVNKVAVTGGASHTVKVRWRVNAGTATIDTTQDQDTATGALSSAVLDIGEVSV